MDLSPSQRQQDLRHGLTAFLASHATTELDVRPTSEPGDGRGLWSDLVSEGWVTVGFPEARGGRGGGVSDLVVVAETLGGGHVPTPLHGGIVLCGQALLAAPGEGDRLRALLSGERTFTYCNWEGFEEPAERPPTVEATETAHGWRLDGSARFVPHGAEADVLLVMAAVRVGGDRATPTLFAVPGSSAGLTTEPVPTVGGGRCSHVSFSEVEVDAAQVVGPVGGAVQWLPRVLAMGRVVLAAEMVGAAAAALAHASHWATTRVQFNAPIGSFQAVQHRLADAYIDVVTARDSVYDAAGIIDRGEEARVAAAAAKAYCSDACRRVTAAAHQVCGGEGIYADQPLHLWHRRVAALVPVLGSVRYLHATVAASVLPD
jgi:alkylation response protein AidB-like acyl-CoA dehydrogenase